MYQKLLGKTSAILLILPLLFVFFLFSSTFLDNNDFMYSAAPIVWSQNGALYRDVPYVQAPLTIFLNLAIMNMFSVENLFMISRVLSMILVLAAVFLAAFALRRTKEPKFIFLFILLCLSNIYILNNGSEMGSYSQPLFLVALALAISTLDLAPWLGGLLVGIALGLSVLAKLNFLFVIPAFLLLMWLKTERSWWTVIFLGIGALVGMLPLAYYAASDFGAFYQLLVRFHYLTLETRELDPVKSASQIVTQLLAFATALAVPAGFLVLRLVSQPSRERWQAWLLALGFLGCGLFMAVVARTIYPQYLAPLVLFLMFFCLPEREAPLERKHALWVIGMTFFVIQFSALLVQTGQRALGERHLAVLEVVKMQRQAEAIAKSLNKCDRRLYSSQPLFLLSRDVEYPPELAAGPYLLALRGGSLKPEDIGVDIDARLKQWAPNLLIYGFYANQDSNFAEVDAKIQDYGKERGFETVILGKVTNREIVISYDKSCL